MKTVTIQDFVDYDKKLVDYLNLLGDACLNSEPQIHELYRFLSIIILQFQTLIVDIAYDQCELVYFTDKSLKHHVFYIPEVLDLKPPNFIDCDYAKLKFGDNIPLIEINLLYTWLLNIFETIDTVTPTTTFFKIYMPYFLKAKEMLNL